MTKTQALFVRTLRTKHHFTWRGVAWRYNRLFQEAYFMPHDNQWYGMDLCKKSAEYFGEDPESHPWN